MTPADLLAQDTPSLLVLAQLRAPARVEQLRALVFDRELFPDLGRAVADGWLLSSDGRRLLAVVDRRLAPDAVDPHDRSNDASFVRAVRMQAAPGRLRIVYVLPFGAGHFETTLEALRTQAVAVARAEAA